MGLGAGLSAVEKRKFLILQGLELRTLRRPARSQTLYRLLYSGQRTAIQSNDIGVNWKLRASCC
jgi:hypothetical protein